MCAARRPATVLIVEDDPSLRELYQKVLTLEGYAVVTAEDGAEALRRVTTELVDAVVLDLKLPRLDGREVKRRLAADDERRTLPVILLTGQLDADVDPDDFACILHKPISIDTLVQAVRDCLAKAAS